MCYVPCWKRVLLLYIYGTCFNLVFQRCKLLKLQLKGYQISFRKTLSTYSSNITMHCWNRDFWASAEQVLPRVFSGFWTQQCAPPHIQTQTLGSLVGRMADNSGDNKFYWVSLHSPSPWAAYSSRHLPHFSYVVLCCTMLICNDITH